MTKRIATLSKNDKGIAGMENARDLVRQSYLSDKLNGVVLTGEGANIFESDNKFTIAI